MGRDGDGGRVEFRRGRGLNMGLSMWEGCSEGSVAAPKKHLTLSRSATHLNQCHPTLSHNVNDPKLHLLMSLFLTPTLTPSFTSSTVSFAHLNCTLHSNPNPLIVSQKSKEKQKMQEQRNVEEQAQKGCHGLRLTLGDEDLVSWLRVSEWRHNPEHI